MRHLASMFLAFTVGVALAASGPSLTSTQQTIVNVHLEQIAAVGSIPTQFIQTMVVARPREGQIALAVLYTHESPSGSGNNYDRRLAVFLKLKSGLSAPIDIVAGGAIRRSLTLRDVKPDRVVLDALNYAPQDAVCCPSIPAVVTFRLSERALVEVGSPNNRMQRTGSP